MSAILVVDDESLILNVIKMALTRFGHTVELATNGAEGIQKFDHRNFDLVITDIRMPGIDGHAVVRHVRNSDSPFIPVVGISGTPWHLANSDFNAMIPKPFSIMALVDTVERLVDKISSTAAAGG